MTGKHESGRPNLMLVRESANDAGDELVRILMKLTSDVERFDSMVVHQREIAGRSEPLSLEAVERLSLEAAEMVASAREALAQLRGVSETRESRASA